MIVRELIMKLLEHGMDNEVIVRNSLDDTGCTYSVVNVDEETNVTPAGTDVTVIEFNGDEVYADDDDDVELSA